MSELTTWLLEQIAADEAVARAVGSGSWRISDGGKAVAQGGRYVAIQPIHGTTGIDEDATAHIARHDPARVLAECAAHKAIVAEHPLLTDVRAEDYCDTCVDTSGLDEVGLIPYPCPTLRALASAYVGQPGWREEWA